MKLLHTADWHLGYRQYGLKVREDDFEKTLVQIGDVAIRENVAAVLVSGDMFDNARPPATAVNAARRFGDRMRENGIRVLAVDGNHDLAGGNWSLLCSFTPMGGAEACATPPDIEIADCGQPVRVAGIDFSRPQQLVERLKDWAGRGVDLNGGILMLHHEFAELTAYSTAMSVQEVEPYLDALNVGYVALGHIHNPVSHTTESGRVYRYPGSTEANDTSEIGIKSVDVIEFKDGKYAFTPIALDTRRFEYVDISSEEALSGQCEKAKADKDTFWLVKVDLSAPGKLVQRVEEALKDSLFRIIPYGSKTIEAAAEKVNVVVGLKDAVGKFFDAGSDEEALVNQLIDTPENVKTVASDYLETITAKQTWKK